MDFFKSHLLALIQLWYAKAVTTVGPAVKIYEILCSLDVKKLIIQNTEYSGWCWITPHENNMTLMEHPDFQLKIHLHSWWIFHCHVSFREGTRMVSGFTRNVPKEPPLDSQSWHIKEGLLPKKWKTSWWSALLNPSWYHLTTWTTRNTVESRWNPGWIIKTSHNVRFHDH